MVFRKVGGVTIRDVIKWEQTKLRIVNFFKYPGIHLQTEEPSKCI
jgi:hypothetical protein